MRFIMELNLNSRIPGFYNLTIPDRLVEIEKRSALPTGDLEAFVPPGGLSLEGAGHMIENVIGMYSLPLGIGLNFRVNERDVLVPMVVEEPSVVAGASFMAKLARAGGGFHAETDPPEMIGQIQLLDLDDLQSAREAILSEKGRLLSLASEVDPLLKKLGGGPRDLEVREFSELAHRRIPGGASHLRCT